MTRQSVRAAVLLFLASFMAGSLAAPGSAEPDGPSADALVGEIPFDPESPPSRVMIDLAVAGSTPFVMMLDTGASGSVLTPRAARALGVSVRRTKSSPYRRKTSLGRDLQFWVDTSSSDTGSGAGGEYGLLGGDFLDDYVLEIDYPGRVVRFYDPKKYAVPETAPDPDDRVVRFRRSGARILVDLEVEGTTLLALLDTGAPAVILAGREAKKAGIAWQELPALEGVGGVLGPIRTYTYEAKRLRFAGFEFADQPIAIAPRGAYNQGGPTDSALGYDVLGQFVMRIDYRRKRIWLHRGPLRARTYWGQREDWLTARDAPTAEEVSENDARVAAEWEEDKATRRYAETASGFVVVDGHRLRQGPKNGEVWYSHEQMLARKKEREQAAAGGKP